MRDFLTVSGIVQVPLNHPRGDGFDLQRQAIVCQSQLPCARGLSQFAKQKEMRKWWFKFDIVWPLLVRATTSWLLNHGGSWKKKQWFGCRAFDLWPTGWAWSDFWTSNFRIGAWVKIGYPFKLDTPCPSISKDCIVVNMTTPFCLSENGVPQSPWLSQFFPCSNFWVSRVPNFQTSPDILLMLYIMLYYPIPVNIPMLVGYNWAFKLQFYQFLVNRTIIIIT